ncbi:hypothetical protein [Lentzea sp. NPDC003310]|uniref:hypothetical protein n=1 Tax=Lentzea sp. NPDC003310 TaxID=3154447 RepID=UPI0033B32CFF
MIVSDSLAVVIDGAGIPFGGCKHGVTWYAQQLAARTMTALVGCPEKPLQEGLEEGIAAVVAQHADSCDLSDPGTPCAAVGILRIGDETVDTLALSDVSVVVETADGPQVTCDLGIEDLSGTEPDAVAGMKFNTPEHDEALRALVANQTATRNREGGWWVAAALPEAARHSVVNSYPRRDVQRAAVMSDGVTRPVDQMKIYSWPEYLDLLDKLGPAGLIDHVRSIEVEDPDGERYPRTKRHDDAALATVVGGLSAAMTQS